MFFSKFECKLTLKKMNTINIVKNIIGRWNKSTNCWVETDTKFISTNYHVNEVVELELIAAYKYDIMSCIILQNNL